MRWLIIVKENFYIKTNRIFTVFKKYSWLFIPLVALVGLWYHKLGLLMMPVMLALPVMGFLKGKYWCGTICPHGSFFDGIILPISKNKEIPAWAKSKITLTIAFSWFMYIFYNRVSAAFNFWGDISFWDKLGFVFVLNYLAVTIIGTLLAIGISARTWCRFCPMGTFQLITYKIGKALKLNLKTDQMVTISEKEACVTCKKCERVCPVQLVPYEELKEKFHLENESCIRCSTCIINCPLNILDMKTKESA